MNFCSHCGSPTKKRIPEGEDRERDVCTNPDCGMIHYQNPKIITGCIPTYNGKVLLCKRAIEPRYGLWTLPAGFMENGETTSEGALRESWEEARANIALEKLYAVYDLPYINQVYFFYKGELENLDFEAGIESLEVLLFEEENIPWRDLAFTVIDDLLKHYFRDKQNQKFPFQHHIIPERRPLPSS